MKIDRKAVSATADIPHQFQGQKVKGHQAALGGCSSHHLQAAGAHCGGSTTGRTACCVQPVQTFIKFFAPDETWHISASQNTVSSDRSTEQFISIVGLHGQQ